MSSHAQKGRIDAAVMAEMRPVWVEARETLSVLAWNAVQRITPEVAAQELQSIAEMIAHLERMKGEAA